MSAKIHTGSFFLEPTLLDILDQVAHIEGQSRARIVERAVCFLLAKGAAHARWKASKRAYTKGAQKIHLQPARTGAHAGSSARQTSKPKPPFRAKYFRRAAGLPRRKSVSTRPHPRTPSLFSALEKEASW